MNRFWKRFVLSIVPAAAAILAFILTEDMRQPMVFVDRWTILMAVIALAQVAVAVLSKKKKQEADVPNAE